MKNLLLASSFKDVSDILANSGRDLEGKTVTFIPTASIVEKVVFYVSEGKKALEKLGLIIDELDVSAAPNEEIATKLKKNDIIYISGGNTFFLLQELKRTGADKIIIEEVNAGKLYVGESAGAIITAPNIEYAKAMDSIKKAPLLTDFTALNLVDFYIVPHYNCFPFKKAAQAILDTFTSTLKLLPISNKDAVIVQNSEVKVEKR